MNILWGVIIVVVAALAVTAMLFVAGRAPEGSYFADGDRASGVFGVLATGFAILLGFASSSLSRATTTRAGAETEARMVAQQFETSQLFPGPRPEGAERGTRAATAGPW